MEIVCTTSIEFESKIRRYLIISVNSQSVTSLFLAIQSKLRRSRHVLYSFLRTAFNAIAKMIAKRLAVCNEGITLMVLES